MENSFVTLNANYKLMCDEVGALNHSAEFFAYQVILNADNGHEFGKLPENVLHSQEVQFAIEVAVAVACDDYVRFFRLLRKATFLQACVMHRKFSHVRDQAILRMSRSYKAYQLTHMTDLLAFNDHDETRDFIERRGFVVNANDEVNFTGGQADPVPIPMHKSNVIIELGRFTSLSEAINGGPLSSYSRHVPSYLHLYDNAAARTAKPFLAVKQEQPQPRTTPPPPDRQIIKLPVPAVAPPVVTVVKTATPSISTTTPLKPSIFKQEILPTTTKASTTSFMTATTTTSTSPFLPQVAVKPATSTESKLPLNRPFLGFAAPNPLLSQTPSAKLDQKPVTVDSVTAPATMVDKHRPFAQPLTNIDKQSMPQPQQQPQPSAVSSAFIKREKEELVDNLTIISEIVTEIIDETMLIPIKVLIAECLNEGKQELQQAQEERRQLQLKQERQERQQFLDIYANDLRTQLLNDAVDDIVAEEAADWIQDVTAERVFLRHFLRRMRRRVQRMRLTKLQVGSHVDIPNLQLLSLFQDSPHSIGGGAATKSSLSSQSGSNLESWLEYESSSLPIDFDSLVEKAANNITWTIPFLWKLSVISVDPSSHVTDWLKNKLNQLRSSSNSKENVTTFQPQCGSVSICLNWIDGIQVDVASVRATSTLIFALPLFEEGASETELTVIQRQFQQIIASLSPDNFTSLLILSPSHSISVEDVRDLLDLNSLSPSLLTTVEIWSMRDTDTQSGVLIPSTKTSIELERHLKLHLQQSLRHGTSNKRGCRLSSLHDFLDDALERVFYAITPPYAEAPKIVTNFNSALVRVAEELKQSNSYSTWPPNELWSAQTNIDASTALSAVSLPIPLSPTSEPRVMQSYLRSVFGVEHESFISECVSLLAWESASSVWRRAIAHCIEFRLARFRQSLSKIIVKVVSPQPHPFRLGVSIKRRVSAEDVFSHSPKTARLEVQAVETPHLTSNREPISPIPQSTPLASISLRQSPSKVRNTPGPLVQQQLQEEQQLQNQFEQQLRKWLQVTDVHKPNVVSSTKLEMEASAEPESVINLSFAQTLELVQRRLADHKRANAHSEDFLELLQDV